MDIKGFFIPSAKNNFKSRFLQSNVLLAFVVLLFVAQVCLTLVSLNFPKNIFFADITKGTLEYLVNQSRQSNGLGQLTPNPKLNEAARMKAENMIQNNYFNHVSPSGTTPWFWFKKAGYVYKYAGENLAIGFFDSHDVFTAWFNSSSHRANILSPYYTEFGTAVLDGFGENGAVVVVQEFASPSAVATNAPAAPVKPSRNIQKPSAQDQAETKEPEIAGNNQKEIKPLVQSSQDVIVNPDGKGSSGFSLKIMNRILYDYPVLLQEIIFGFAMIIIGVLISIIYFNFGQMKNDLLVRAGVILILLSSALMFNETIILSFFPTQIII